MILWKILRQTFLYFLVGVIATLVEWGIFYILDVCLLWHYTVATAAAFAVSTFANWGAGRVLIFHNGRKYSLWKELLYIYLASVVGLLANIVIMWVAIDLIGCGDMIAKIIATAIVFFGNFSVRKFLIYKV